jgi:tRNA G18 (ribose-2'-O)-methylase SpoU
MPIITITDLADPRLADYAHLTDVALKKARGSEHGLYLAESLLVMQRALRAGHQPRSVLALGGSVDDAVNAIGDLDIPIFVGPGELLEELTGYVLHRGIIASMHRPALPSVESLLGVGSDGGIGSGGGTARDGDAGSDGGSARVGDAGVDGGAARVGAAGSVDRARRIVVLENVADPTNVGAIFRSVAAIGADAVLVTPRCSDPFYRRAIRVSMGTVLQVPWTRVGDWPSTREMLVAAGFHIAALALTDDAVDLPAFAATAPDRVALVLGAEGEGLTPEAIAAADTVVRIPMAHGIDSLNVAATAAVAMYALAG